MTDEELIFKGVPDEGADPLDWDLYQRIEVYRQDQLLGCGIWGEDEGRKRYRPDEGLEQHLTETFSAPDPKEFQKKVKALFQFRTIAPTQ